MTQETKINMLDIDQLAVMVQMHELLLMNMIELHGNPSVVDSTIKGMLAVYEGLDRKKVNQRTLDAFAAQLKKLDQWMDEWNQTGEHS